MEALLLGVTLLLATSVMAQQAYPSYAPPRENLSSFYGDLSSAQTQLPPETHPPARGALPNAAVEQQIQTKIADEPALHGTNLKVTVNESSVTLTGTVDSEQQHNLALRVAQSCARDRSIDDRIQVRGKA